MLDARHAAPRLDAADPDEWWRGLVDLYCEEADHADDAHRAARHLAEAARIRHEELGDPDGARALYARAHALHPDDPLAARALADLAERAGDFAEAREWLEAALEATPDDPGRVSLLARLCGLLHDRLGERAAAATCAREALERAPDDRVLLARLHLLTEPDDPAGQRLILQHTLDLTDDPARRAALLVQIGRVHEAAHRDDERALRAYEAAFVADPDHPPALDGLVRVLLRTERWEALVELLADAVGRVADERTRGRLHVLAALTLGVRLDAPERARPHLGAAATSLGDDPVAIAEIAGLYERLGQWKRANAVLEAQAADDPGAWYRIGLNLEAGLGDAAGALEAHRRAVGADAEGLPALAALRRNAWRADRLDVWRRAVEGLLRHADDPAVREALAGHLADVLLTRIGEVETARRRYADAVSAAFRAAGDRPLLLPIAFEERARLLRAQGNLPVLEEELRAALARPLHPLSRAMVAAQLAELCEGPLGRPDEALRLFADAATHDPDDRAAHEARQRLLRARGDWPALLDALRAERDRAEPGRRRIVLTRIADVQHAMGDPEGAEDTWREALALDPAWMPALRGLGRQLYQHGRWRDLAALHEHELRALGPDDPGRPGLLGKLAELYAFRLDQPDDAIAHYEALLAARPGAPDAAAGLERLYRQSERWAALARVLATRAAHLDDAPARAAVLIRLADVRLDRLGDVDGAREAYEAAARLMPELLPAGWAIERIALTEGDGRRLATLYRGMLAAAGTAGQRAILRHKLAAVVDPLEAGPALEDAVEEADDAEAAWALVREAAEIGDGALLAGRLARMAQLVDNRRDALALWIEAAEQGEGAELPAVEQAALWTRVRQIEPAADRPWAALLRLHRAARTPGAEAELLLLRADETADDREKALALWTAGLIEEARGMPSVGRDAFREALTACATDPVPAWLLLERALGGDDTLQPADHADQLVGLARRQAHGPSAARRLFEAGQLRAELLGDRTGALAVWLEAVRRDPGAAEAAERAEAILEAGKSFGELAALLAHRAARLVEPAERAPVLRRLADVRLEHLGERAEAAETLEELVQLTPADLDARVRLGDLRYSLEQFAAAAAHYRTAALAAHDDRLLGRLYTRLGRIKARHLGDPAGAIEDLRRAVGLGTDDRALAELAQTYLLAGEADLALMAFQRLEKLAEAPADLSAARAGQVHALLRRGRRAEAIERLGAFRQIDPVDPMLATLARDLGLAPPEPEPETGEPLMRRTPGRALAATGEAIGAIALHKRPASARPLAPTLDPSPRRVPADSDERADAADRSTDHEPPSLAATTPPAALEDEPLARAVSADVDAAFAALGRAPLPPGHGPDDTLDPRPPSAPPAERPPSDRPVEAIVIPSPLDASIEDEIDDELAAAFQSAALEDEVGPFDAMADTGSIQTLDPVDQNTGSLPDLAAASMSPALPPVLGEPDDDLGDLELTARAPSTADRAAELLDALPAISGERNASDIVNLLQPDIERMQSGSMPALRAARRSAGAPAARAEDSLEIDISTGGWRPTPARGAPTVAAPGEKHTTPLSPAELALERLKLGPLDLDAWAATARVVEGPAAEWVADAAAWIEGDVQPGQPPAREGPLPRALALTVRPPAVPEPLAALLAELAPLLVEPVLAEGRRRTSGEGGDIIAPDAPLGRLAARYARLLGLDEMELVQNPERPYSVSVEPGDGRLRLVLGAAIVEGADDAGRSFLLARTMVPVAYGTLAARQLRQRESRAFFGALFDQLGAEFPLRGRDRRQIERYGERLAPYLGAVDDHPPTVALAAEAADAVRRQGIAGLRAGLDLFDNRLALALAHGFGGAMEMLRLLDFDDRPRGALGPDELSQLVADSDIARDLLVFAATPACHAIRAWLSHAD